MTPTIDVSKMFDRSGMIRNFPQAKDMACGGFAARSEALQCKLLGISRGVKDR
jgi:hypothetical protein